jgi:outer membrane receptor for ferrienterochelin and colicins
MKFLYALVLFALTAATVYAQKTGKLTGKVLSSDGQPAACIVIYVDGKAVTQTPEDGCYSLQLLPGQHQFSAVFMGSTQAVQTINITAGQVTTMNNVVLKETAMQLKDVVVTGQYEPQSLKNSVYQVRTISNERIRLRGATNVQQVLSTELGIRLNNDLALGTTDIELLGVTGHRVKVLLDGVPLLDRGEIRESLGQIDINMIDHIELVEGPMSVMYGTDALGGVINLITKKAAPGGSNLAVGLRVQEESSGKQYKGFDGKGTHNQSINVKWQRNGFTVGANTARNNFGGWEPGNGFKNWLPKNQLLGSVNLGYRAQTFNVWYRVNATNEDIFSRGLLIPATNTSKDQKYITHRYLHELQGDARLSNKLSFNASAAYTDYSRRTQTTEINYTTGDRRLTALASEQARAAFNNTFVRGMALYKVSPHIALQPGFEINLTGSTGERILGTPTINDFAFFASSEFTLGKLSVRPGIRFIHNSVYNAPPAIPSVNTKVALSPVLDLRAAYARGFRAPALQELYFSFFDASHSIIGNANLQAEYSNSFNGSLSWQAVSRQQFKLKTVIGGFYNRFNNFIDVGTAENDATLTTYLNIGKYRTVGGSIDNTINYKNLQATLGFYYTGRYNQLNADDGTIPDLSWSPELNSNITYAITKWKSNISLFYKLNGVRPGYRYFTENGATHIRRVQVSAFQMADLTLNKVLKKAISLNAGIRNLFNVTQVNNTDAATGAAHNDGGAVPMGYGRSFFLGFNYQFTK